MRSSDLQVVEISDALAGVAVDLVVCGSIGAVESVRFIRSLRRLGAKVTPWLTRGGKQFITPTSLGWAADRPVREHFSGDASHIATGDVCLVAPASASMIAKIAHGVTDSPAAALIASYLGAQRPVMLVPNMHDSLADSPGVRSNLEQISRWLTVIEPRLEEAKHKFPEPAVLADRVAHLFNLQRRNPKAKSVLVTLGSTRGYIDDVRYISNYSSGKLGSLIAEELFRCGLATYVVAGPCKILPRTCTRLVEVETNDAMQLAATNALHDGAEAAVLAASVLDFTPDQKTQGKISSSSGPLTVSFQTTEKIIAKITPSSGIKVGFKLESSLDEKSADQWAAKYIPTYGLSLMVLNALTDVDENRHKAFIYEPKTPGKLGDKTTCGRQEVSGKSNVARSIATHIRTRLHIDAR